MSADYIKILLDKEELEKIFQNQNLKRSKQVIGKNDSSTNQISEYPIKSYFHNMCFKITKQRGEVYGSLHKLINNLLYSNNSNHNDFNPYLLEGAMYALQSYMGVESLPPNKLTNFEYGFNIELGESPFALIQESLLFYDLKKDSVDSRHKKNEIIKKFTFTDYEIKVYDKRAQYGLGKNIIRVEVKYTSAKILEKIGLTTLDDLLSLEIQDKLFQDYIHKINELTIIDCWNGCTSLHQVTDTDRSKLEKFTNANYWAGLRRDKKYMDLNRKRKEFEKLVFKYCLDGRKKNLISSIIAKYQSMKDDYIQDKSISYYGEMLEKQLIY